MFRTCLQVSMLMAAVPSFCHACECVNTERACEYLRSETVFVGRVLDTSAVKHTAERNSWTSGYSMRFAVEESVRGQLGSEVIVETGNGGGDCGTPLPPGRRFLIFAHNMAGKLWTGMCSGNQQLPGTERDKEIVEPYRRFIRSGTGSIFGRVFQVKPIWQEDEVADGRPTRPMRGMKLRAESGGASALARTASDGTFEFSGLPIGKYKVIPEVASDLDFDHEFEDRYEAEISTGQCVNIGFAMRPRTRIRGHVTFPPGIANKTIEVVAIPTHIRNLNQFSGKGDFTDERNRFDLWPLPPGDYYVGVNINSTPKADSPFPPTYYPGVTEQKAARIVHIAEGEIKDLEISLPESAVPRAVHFRAIGLDGKPLRTIYVQIEDLRHPGDAASYVNVDLDPNGAGTLNVFSGYSYHLHGSHWVKYGVDWCAKPVVVPAGAGPVNVQFVMYGQSANCDLAEIDGLRR